jgi:hypothetical protein
LTFNSMSSTPYAACQLLVVMVMVMVMVMVVVMA